MTPAHERVLLDTSVVIDFPARAVAAHAATAAVSTITLAELSYGLHASDPLLNAAREKAAEIKENEQALSSLTRLLAAQGERLAQAQSDPDPQSRLLATRVLEIMAQARQRMRHRWESLPDIGPESRPNTSAQLRPKAPANEIVLTAAQDTEKQGTPKAAGKGE